MASHTLAQIFSQLFSPEFSAFLSKISIGNVIKQLVQAFSVRILSYGCNWEIWRALKKLELLSAVPQATLKLLSCSPNFPSASITRYMYAKHEPIVKWQVPIQRLYFAVFLLRLNLS